MKNNRFVFDTNVIISALMFPQSIPRQAFDAAKTRGTLLASTPIIIELNEVLSRKKFERYFSEEERIQFIAKFFNDAEIVEIKENIQVCRDRKDDKFLEIAVNGSANCIITGDRDLLVLHPFRNINIVLPNEFLLTL
jgi:putative PIN family toxin of toxin-antitoxin system